MQNRSETVAICKTPQKGAGRAADGREFHELEGEDHQRCKKTRHGTRNIPKRIAEHDRASCQRYQGSLRKCSAQEIT